MKFEDIKDLFPDLKLNQEQKNKILTNVSSEIKSFGFEPHFVSFSRYLNNNGKIDDIIFTEVSETENFCISQAQNIETTPASNNNDVINIQL